MSQFLSVAVDHGVAVVTLDQALAPVNTVSPAWIDEMTAAFEALKADIDVRGVIITSAKAGFMAGAHLTYILEQSAHMTPVEAFEFSQRATALHRLIETCGKPVAAVMGGFALGGGYELALACAYRVLADDPQAVVGLPEVNLGLLPGSGGTQRLPRMIGVQKALSVLLEGRRYPPAEALALGLVDLVAPAAEILQLAKDWIAANPDPTRPWDKKGFRIAESDGLLKQSTAGMFTHATGTLLARYGANYPAPIAILTCVFEGIQTPLDAGLRIESRHFARLMTDPTSRNLIRTSFVNKGLAERGARRPEGFPKSKVAKLGVLGAGMMGRGIAYVAAKAGVDVVLMDLSIDAANRAKDLLGASLTKDIEKGRTTQAVAEAVLGRIHPAGDYAELAGADLVVEAVFEDTAIKAEVTRNAAAALGPRALFASNTSTLPISQLAEAFPRPGDFIGLHFFSPVDRMSLVEVIMGQKTTLETLARALDFVAQIRKTPIVVNDSRGFYTSRVFQTFIHEGMELLREGVAPALIENGAKQAGMPVGPLALLDEVTLELPMKIVRQSEAEEPSYRRPTSMQVMEKMVQALGRTGRKGGGGFYEYPADRRKHIWPGLSEHFPPAPAQPSVEAVKQRLLYVQALETARCLEEGVLSHPADADLGAVLGWGFPAWSGGTLSLIETVGVAKFVSQCEALAAQHGPRFAPTAQLRAMAETGEGFAY
jgi:3-hydroxyacyl-CoA dehydrogenase/enoyl-CoA hydratase/3-hydroxybutyryl-CoA epimerase